MFSKILTKSYTNKSLNLNEEIKNAEVIIIGAGSGLSNSAGFTYSGNRFIKYFSDFKNKYHFNDMYSGGFYPFNSLEEYWAYWSRYIYINRYIDIPNNTYDLLYKLVKDKEYFVITTNVDHAFQKSGFDKDKLFYTQGDYGLLQCSTPCKQETFDNKNIIRNMVISQGYKIDENENLVEDNIPIKMTIPTEQIPCCPYCGKPLTTNLRADNYFVEDKGWHIAKARYEHFLHANKNKKVLFLELGVGSNTPIIIKYPFWRMTYEWKNAKYACINYGEAFVPNEIEKKSICINDDIKTVLENII